MSLLRLHTHVFARTTVRSNHLPPPQYMEAQQTENESPNCCHSYRWYYSYRPYRVYVTQHQRWSSCALQWRMKRYHHNQVSSFQPLENTTQLGLCFTLHNQIQIYLVPDILLCKFNLSLVPCFRPKMRSFTDGCVNIVWEENVIMRAGRWSCKRTRGCEQTQKRQENCTHSTRPRGLFHTRMLAWLYSGRLHIAAQHGREFISLLTVLSVWRCVLTELMKCFS